jgi:hypothetical protein
LEREGSETDGKQGDYIGTKSLRPGMRMDHAMMELLVEDFLPVEGRNVQRIARRRYRKSTVFHQSVGGCGAHGVTRPTSFLSSSAGATPAFRLSGRREFDIISHG